MPERIAAFCNYVRSEVQHIPPKNSAYLPKSAKRRKNVKRGNIRTKTGHK